MPPFNFGPIFGAKAPEPAAPVPVVVESAKKERAPRAPKAPKPEVKTQWKLTTRPWSVLIKTATPDSMPWVGFSHAMAKKDQCPKNTGKGSDASRMVDAKIIEETMAEACTHAEPVTQVAVIPTWFEDTKVLTAVYLRGKDVFLYDNGQGPPPKDAFIVNKEGVMAALVDNKENPSLVLAPYQMHFPPEFDALVSSGKTMEALELAAIIYWRDSGDLETVKQLLVDDSLVEVPVEELEKRVEDFTAKVQNSSASQ